MSTPQLSSPFSFRLSKRSALLVQTSIGVALAAIILFDVYQDWIPEGKPLWTTLAENAIPLLLALSVPLMAWTLAQSEEGEPYVREATKWTVMGCLATLMIAGLALGFQVVQGEIKPLIFIAQLTAVGAVTGLSVGYVYAKTHHSPQQEETDPDPNADGFTQDQLLRSPRGALLLLGGLGVALAGAVLFDVYQDAIIQDKPPWTTLAENAIPFLLATAIPVIGWQLARSDQGTLYVTEAAIWSLAGAGVTLTVAGVVLGFQVVQGELKPGVVVTQLTTIGAIAGLFVGYNVARARRIRGKLRKQESRLRGLANSVPGGIFQLEVGPGGAYDTTFVSDATRRLLGSPLDREHFFEDFFSHVPMPHREEVRASIEASIDRAEGWDVEIPFEDPSGTRTWIRSIATPERRGETLVYHGVTIGITTKKERERQLDAVFNQTFQFTGLMRPDGTLIRVNDTALQFGGIEEEDVIGHSIWDAYWFQGDHSNRDRLKESVSRAANGEFIRYEVEVQGADDDRIIDFSIRPIQNEAGDVTLLVPEGRDITDRKRKEQALQEERDRFETLFESLPVPVVRCLVEEDEAAVVADTNQAFEDTFGLEAAAAEGQDINKLLVPEEDRKEALQLDRRALKEGRFETEVRREAAGGPRDFQLQAARRVPTEGPPEIYAIYADITEQKKRERQLDAIFNHTFQFTGLLRPDGTVVEVNDTALQFGGLDREAVIGKPLWDTHWAQTGEESKQRLKEAIRRAADGEFVRHERPVQGRDGTRLVDFSIRPVTDEKGEVTLLIPEARDISERKEYERKLKEAKEKAEESSRLKTAMLANMSHEIRTPLTPINGFAESLAEELSGPKAELARRIRKSGERLQETIDSVLELSQLEAGTQELSREPFDLREAVEKCLDVLDTWAEQEGVTVQADLPDEPVKGQWDEAALRRIAENLVENAIKFTPKGGQVTVQVEATNGKAALEVEDTGIGISEESVPKVFEAFRQESEGMDREFEGTGLGLSIVQRLTHALDGSIEVEGEKGEGARFVVYLPQSEESPSEGATSRGDISEASGAEKSNIEETSNAN